METTKNIHALLADRMNWEHSETEAPDLSQMMQARKAVMARKKITVEKKGFFSMFIAFLHFDLKFYHLGISVLLLMVGSFYITDSHYGTSAGATLSEHNANALSIKSSTISVISNTMLTSIPTLRN